MRIFVQEDQEEENEEYPTSRVPQGREAANRSSTAQTEQEEAQEEEDLNNYEEDFEDVGDFRERQQQSSNGLDEEEENEEDLEEESRITRRLYSNRRPHRSGRNIGTSTTRVAGNSRSSINQQQAQGEFLSQFYNQLYTNSRRGRRTASTRHATYRGEQNSNSGEGSWDINSLENMTINEEIQVREDARFLNPFPIKHPQKSTIQHWQLRDLIHSPFSREEFVYVNQNNVLRYNTRTKESKELLKDLTFSPTSMTVGCGYVAAGGQRSQLMVRNMELGNSFITSVGGSINNSMCISEHLNDTRLLISNNDETIKIYSLPSLTHVSNLPMPTAVNYTAVSPDGTKMVAVGDSKQGWLFDVRNGYHRQTSFTATTDAGFSCAWNCSSDKFAVASQDGYVTAWDIRNVAYPLAKLGSKQSPQVKGACRSVKFTRNSAIDLLAFSEHTSYVHVVDARTFNERQTIRVAPYDCDQHISGLCFSPDSKAMFVGMESIVQEYDVDTICRRRFADGSLC